MGHELVEHDAEEARRASLAAVQVQCLDDQVAVVAGNRGIAANQLVAASRSVQQREAHVVAQVNDVEQGRQVVVAVLAAADDAQEQIDLRRV